MSREAFGMNKEAWEISAANEFDERHKVIISDCKIYRDQASRNVTFEFLLDVGEGAEARTQSWYMCGLWSERPGGKLVPGWDYVRGSGTRAPSSYSQGLLDLCETIGIDYEDLKNDRVSMDNIIGKEIACAIGEKEIVRLSSIYREDSWEEEIRRFWGFVPVADMLIISVPD